MADRPWLASYPDNVPADIDVAAYSSLVELMDEAFGKYASRTAYSFPGGCLSFEQTDKISSAIAGYLQSAGLAKSDRVGVMMPNCPYYPVTVAGILRAGLVVVNINPRFTPRELDLQLTDSGCRAIFVHDSAVDVLERTIGGAGIEQVILCRAEFSPVTGRQPAAEGGAKATVGGPAITRIAFEDAIEMGARRGYSEVNVGPEDIAVLQYTGGTTGTSKGAVLLHRNLVANVLQSEAWYKPAMDRIPVVEQPASLCALPLYHIFAFTAGMMRSMRNGGKLVLIPDVRDLASFFTELRKHRIHTFPGVNTLFKTLLNDPRFDSVDWSHLKVCTGGGMAVQSAVARQWYQRTGCHICEGYGLTETSPTASCNPTIDTQYTGSIGLPLPGTWMRVLDDNGDEVPVGQIGEIAISGPQVMAGYWQQPDETAKVMTADGYFRTGDIGWMDEKGYFRIVDRKKDMILVSGFNVYPNEIENVVASIDGVLECAAVGVADDRSGEAVKLVIVLKDHSITEEDIRAYCRENMAGYKQPRIIEFRSEIPKTPVGKILRRQMREASSSAADGERP